ncbi:MAG: SCP2 sterol-binding domain-containing protein [Candidatus Bathycorpusculaceae bacterium]
MVLYLTKEWLEEYCKMLNQNKEYREAGKGWGIGWNGDFVFQIENIPVDKVAFEKLPSDVAEGLREYVINGTAYSYLRLKDGECLEARPIKDPKEVQAGFVQKGPYENWKKITRGELDPTRALLTGKFKLEGDMAKVMRYSRAANLMAKIAASIKTEFPDEVYPK